MNTLGYSTLWLRCVKTYNIIINPFYYRFDLFEVQEEGFPRCIFSDRDKETVEYVRTWMIDILYLKLRKEHWDDLHDKPFFVPTPPPPAPTVKYIPRP